MPIEHANSLMKTLDKENIHYEKLIKDKGNHGFYKKENIFDANEKIVNFLNWNIGLK